MLKAAELEEFKWTVDEYIKLGMSGDPAWHKQLENVSARVHLNCLEALEIQLQENNKSSESIEGENRRLGSS